MTAERLPQEWRIDRDVLGVADLHVAPVPREDVLPEEIRRHEGLCLEGQVVADQDCADGLNPGQIQVDRFKDAPDPLEDGRHQIGLIVDGMDSPSYPIRAMGISSTCPVRAIVFMPPGISDAASSISR